MTASSSKGVTVCMTTGTGTSLVPTAITKASPAQVTVASTTGLTNGDIITIANGGTGFAELDGKSWVVSNVATGKFDLLGSDTTASTGTLAGTPSITTYNAAATTCLCLSELSFNPENPGTVSVATFCDPSASIPQATTSAGTVDIGGYVDISAADYKALLKASIDGKSHEFRVMLPGNGYIMFKGVLGAFNWSVPLDGAISYSGQVILSSKPVHLF